MTKQEIFDTVATHLISQGKKSLTLEPIDVGARMFNLDTGACCYRSQDGSKCAAGCLIPDDQYTFRMEGQKASHLPFFKDNFLKLDLFFIDDLQSIHDAEEVSSWKEHLKVLASQNNLTLPECLQ